MRTDASSWIVLAHLLRPQGRKGEILAELLTDFPESLAGRDDLFLIPEDAGVAEEDAKRVQVSSAWLPLGKNRGRVVLQIDGIASIAEAESIAGLDLAVAQEKRLSLDEETAYVSDLEGCIVFDGEVRIGEITGVQFPAASDGARRDDVPSLLEVQSFDGNEILIPFVKDFLVSIDLASKTVRMKLPAGLVEVNR